MFSNIELPLGYNIMTLEYVLERINYERKSQKKIEKRENRTDQALFWVEGVLELVFSFLISK